MKHCAFCNNDLPYNFTAAHIEKLKHYFCPREERSCLMDFFNAVYITVSISRNVTVYPTHHAVRSIA